MWDCKGAHVPPPGHWSRTAHEDEQDRRDLGWIKGQVPFGQHRTLQWDLAAGWGEEHQSCCLPRAPGSGKAPSFNSLSFDCIHPPPQPGPSYLIPLPAPRIIYHAVVTAFELLSRRSKGEKLPWFNEQQQQHPSSQGCLGCHSQTHPTTSSHWDPTSHHPKSPAAKPGAPAEPRSCACRAGRMRTPKGIPKAAPFPVLHAPAQALWRQEGNAGVPALGGSSQSCPSHPWGWHTGYMGYGMDGKLPHQFHPLTKGKGIINLHFNTSRSCEQQSWAVYSRLPLFS